MKKSFKMTGRTMAMNILNKIKKMVKSFLIPLEQELGDGRVNPFQTLVAIILSARTKDSTTAKVAPVLFQYVKTPADLVKMSVKKLELLIHSAGFFRSKAKNLKNLANILESNSRIPDSLEGLLNLPGVGRKTATLFLSRIYGKSTVCVDTHVFRISNRLFFRHSQSRNPFETEKRLMELFPRRTWSTINTLLVKFGQNICLPVRPLCPECLVRMQCGYYQAFLRTR